MKIWATLVILWLIPAYSFAWTKAVNKDSMSDETTIILTSESKNAVWASKKALLDVYLKCGKKPKLVLSHPFVVGNGPVDLRIDEGKAFKAYASPSTGHKALFIGDDSSSTNSPKALLSKIKSGHRLRVRYSDATNASVDAEFPVFGLEKEMNDACPKP